MVQIEAPAWLSQRMFYPFGITHIGVPWVPSDKLNPTKLVLFGEKIPRDKAINITKPTLRSLQAPRPENQGVKPWYEWIGNPVMCVV